MLNQTCIDRHDFEFCLVDPYPLLDGLYAVCCYEDYCNAPDPSKRVLYTSVYVLYTVPSIGLSVIIHSVP